MADEEQRNHKSHKHSNVRLTRKQVDGLDAHKAGADEGWKGWNLVAAAGDERDDLPWNSGNEIERRTTVIYVIACDTPPTFAAILKNWGIER